ncbi:immunoglobulin-like domain-containing protein [Microbacterium testaceum]|uniref:immunoglobulin-like domain-containing protein n=1 Tax=Microbacterium testaceum TaxID=2033 RepID=UPI0009BF6609|nr:LamG-like jellyroll fold domain-containing protein [Microbacterium testaceum]
MSTRMRHVWRNMTVVAGVSALACGLLSPTAASAAVTVPTPVLKYTFDALPASVPAGYAIADSGSASHPGTVVNTGATSTEGPRGSSDTALRLPGGAANSAAPYVQIAPGVVSPNATDVTLSAWIRWSGAPECTWPFTLGASQSQHILFTTSCGNNQYGAINNFGEVRATATGASPADTWAHVAVVVDGGVSVTTYVNGVQAGTGATGSSATAAVGTSTFSGYLGKSFYGPDAYWAGAIDDFTVYDQALTGDQLKESERAVFASLAQKDAATSAGDLSAVTTDLTLPTTGANGSKITWTSSAPGVIGADGVVNRPRFPQGDATVTLTPTATLGGQSVAGTPQTATVTAWAQGDGPEAQLARTVAQGLRDMPQFSGPVRGSLTLPNDGSEIESLAGVRDRGDAVITWATSNAAVVTAADRGSEPNVVKKGALTRPATAQTVTLTATITVSGADPVTVSLPLEVPAATTQTADDYEAYLFAYFTGDSLSGEQIRFATSDGNDALRWKNLNGAQPVIESTKGTRGLRDPFIMRSHEGDRFFLLATDLSVGRTGWSGSIDRGSQYLEIWESTDLVNWSEQRHVKVNLPNAGMTWAPEAFYDPTIQSYVVYYTSSLYTDDTRTVGDGNGPQIMTTITRDFRTFSTPQPWFKASDVPGLVKGSGLIDSTILKDGETYYRFTKATEASGCPSADIIGQKSTNLRATTASGAWTLFDTCIGRTAGTPEVEGPSAFLANPGDVNKNKYMLWVDNFFGVGYIPLMTNSLEGDVRWTYPSSFSLPASPRHGSVMPITREERDVLAGKWGRDLLVTGIDGVTAEVNAGASGVQLPGTVAATFADGHRENVAVTWDAVTATQLDKPGVVEVSGTLTNGAATRAKATVTVKGAPMPIETTVSSRCVSGKVTLVASLKNTSANAVKTDLVTPYGKKSFTTIAPGKTVSASFTTRSASIGAGEVSVTASTNGGANVSAKTLFAAHTCR